MVTAGTIALLIGLILLGDRMPPWLGIIIMISYPYGLIFWT
jgi:hypothetical protein